MIESETNKGKKKAMVATWSDSENDSIEEENGKEVANMCSMAIDENDEVNLNLRYDDLQDAFEALYEYLEKLGLTNVSLRRKFEVLKRNLRRKIFKHRKCQKFSSKRK